jgi:hypothetical protein
MKTNLLTVVLAILITIPLISLGQTHTIDKLYEKYAGKEGFTSINISSEMFKLAASLGAASDPSSKNEINDIVNQIKGMKILIYNQAMDGLDREAFKKELRQSIQTKDFSELMSISEQHSNVKFLTKSGTDSKIRELVMVAEDGKEIVVMSFTGLIDLETIGKISKTMNMQGMDKLDKLNKAE